MPKSPYFLDSRLIPRLKQVIRSQNGNINVSFIATELQSQFSEYSRKKRIVFLKTVEKAYPVAVKELQKEGFQVNKKDSNTDSSNSESELVQYEDKNVLNNMINNMYKQNQAPSPHTDNSQLSSTPITPANAKTKPLEKNAQDSSESKSQAWYIDRGEKSSKKGYPHTPTSIFCEDNGGKGQMSDNKNLDSSKQDRPRKRRRDSPDLFRKRKKQREAINPTVAFANVGGNENILQHLEERCRFLEYPELLHKVKGDLPKSFLFHGPTGCGKTLLANAIAGEYQLPFLGMTATELVGGISGDSEANIRDLFEQAADLAPCILFVDDVDAIATKRETATKGMESRVVTQLANSMDELRTKNLPVLIICATNRPNSLDEAFRRTGRFDIEYAMRFPNRDARKSILEAICKEVVLADDVSLSDIADLTPGYVGCDLKTLISITNACALHRVLSEHKRLKRTNCMDQDTTHKRKKITFSQEEIENFEMKLTKADFQALIGSKSFDKDPVSASRTNLAAQFAIAALFLVTCLEGLPKKAMTEVKPTAKQEDVILVPNTTWDDIGGLDNIRKKLNLCIMERTKRPELYQAIGMASAAGVLLVGPPGCGKTSVARAVANEAGINFLYIKGAELLNKYVGESEKNVRDLFKRASSLAPCVIFFDEIDSICPRRSTGSEENSTSRVTNQLLLEMSGLEQRTEVYVIAATNRLDRLDKAFLRPGRMDKIIYVGLPTPEGRVEILKALTKNGTRPKLAKNVSLEILGLDERCDGFSGADLGNLVQVAREACLEEIIESTEASQPWEVPEVTRSHFEMAFDSVSPSVDIESKRNYEAVKKLLEKKTAKKDMMSLDADSKTDPGKSVDLP